MTQTTLMRRLSDANPIPQVSPLPADELFAQITAEPGDPRLTARPVTGTRRHRRLVAPRVRVRAVAISSVAGAGAVAAVIATGAFNSGGGVSAPTITVAGAHAQEVAYIVGHVRAHLAADDGGAFVTESSIAGTTEGSGTTETVGWAWTDPQTGMRYVRSTVTDQATGDPISTYWSALRQTSTDPDGQVVDSGTSINIDYQTQTYTQSPTTLTYTPGQATGADLSSSSSQIAQDLTDGTVTETGTTQVNGTPAIELSVSGNISLTLYVDASTDQPLRAVISNPANSDNIPITTDLLPASAANIARAQEPAIPAGYSAATPVSSGS